MAGQNCRNHTVEHAKSTLKQPGRSLEKGGAKDARLRKSKMRNPAIRHGAAMQARPLLALN
jgi:hypothetical protein